MKKRTFREAIVIIIMTAVLPLAAEETRQVRIEWEAVKGAQGYVVQVKDGEGREVAKKTVTPSYAVIDLAPGSYKIKISALNVFLKPGSSSDWADIIVKKKEQPRDDSEGGSLTQIGKLGKEAQDSSNEEALKKEEAVKKAEALKKEEEARRKSEGYPRGVAGLGPLDIAFGGSFHFPVTGWKKYLNYSPGGHAMISYRLSGIEAVKNIPVLSNFGFALTIGVVPFEGKTRDQAKMSLMAISPGAGLFYDFKLGTVKLWAFDLRLAGLVGASFTNLSIQGIFPKNKMITRLYYDPQLSFRFAYDGYFFMEAGCGYQSVLFSGEPLSSVYPFVRFGFRL